MSTWADLRELRLSGRRPSLPLCVTTLFSRCLQQAEAGAMVIVHVPGDKLDVELLDGLEVECFLDDCSQSFAVGQLVKSRSIRPAKLTCWCRCTGESDSFWPRDCRHGAECADAWERLCQPRAT